MNMYVFLWFFGSRCARVKNVRIYFFCPKVQVDPP
jgi:hypothetical protein